MYCKFCGHQLEDEAVFCGKCGKRALTEAAPQSSKKQRVIAGILGILLGFLGIHNFYLGFNTKAIIQLCLTIISGGSLVAVSSIWGFAEGILILCGVINHDASKNPLI